MSSPSCNHCGGGMRWLELFSSAEWYCPCKEGNANDVSSGTRSQELRY